MIDPTERPEVRQAATAEKLLKDAGFNVMRGTRERIAHILTVFAIDKKQVYKTLSAGMGNPHYQIRDYGARTLNITFFSGDGT